MVKPAEMLPRLREFIWNVFQIVPHLRDHGSFKPAARDRGRQRPERVANVEEAVLESVEERPGVSTRRLGLEHQISRSTTWRILKAQQLYPYHVQKYQCLQPGDLPRRRRFCEWVLAKINEQPNFLSTVLSTDEAGFTREGIFNMRNTHIWAEENPHGFREHSFQRQFSINVWAGIVNGQLIGPYIMPNRLNGEEYLHFLNNVLFQLVEDVPLDIRANMWYLHDGAPCHNARVVRNWLDAHFPGQWIGRNGPVAWPARSPDLNPCEFFFWGYMKDLVYSVPIETIEVLRERVDNSATMIRNNRSMLQNVEQSFRRRINSNGGHFEHLL